MDDNGNALLDVEHLRPFWLGTAEISGAENLWGGIGGRKSISIDGSNLTIKFPWLRRISMIRHEPITDPTGRTRCYTIVSARLMSGGLRVHCGDVIISLRRRR